MATNYERTPGPAEQAEAENKRLIEAIQRVRTCNDCDLCLVDSRDLHFMFMEFARLRALAGGFSGCLEVLSKDEPGAPFETKDGALSLSTELERPIPPMTTLTAVEALWKARTALGDLPESAALNVAKARIEDVIQFFESEIAYFNTRGL